MECIKLSFCVYSYRNDKQPKKNGEKMKTSFDITNDKKMTTEEIMDFYIEHGDKIEKFWESKRGQRYGELMTEYEEMDTDESWEDFISRQPIPKEN